MSTINGPKMSTILWIDQNCLISQFFIFILGCGVVLRNRVDLGFAAGEKTNTVKVSPIFAYFRDAGVGGLLPDF